MLLLVYEQNKLEYIYIYIFFQGKAQGKMMDLGGMESDGDQGALYEILK